MLFAKSSDTGLTSSNKNFTNEYFGRIRSNGEGLIYIPSGDGVYIQSSDDGETLEEIELLLIDWFQGMTIQGKTALHALGGKLY